MFRNKAALLALGVFFAASASASPSGCLDRTIPVSISSHDGTPVPELAASRVEGTYDKKPVAIKLVQLEERPPRFILLIDNSGSMNMRYNAAIDAAERLLSKLPSNLEVGLAFFATEAVPVMLPTTDRRSLSDQLEGLRRNRLSFKGKTALWSAVLQGAKMLGIPTMGDVIYVISDGEDNRSNTGAKVVQQTLRNAGIRLFALVLQSPLGIRPMAMPVEITGPASVQLVSPSTGGAVVAAYYAGSPFPAPPLVGKNGKLTQLGQDFDQQVAQIFRFYRVELSLPETPSKAKDLKLDLVGFSKAARDKLELNYPAAVLPCP